MIRYDKVRSVDKLNIGRVEDLILKEEVKNLAWIGNMNLQFHLSFFKDLQLLNSAFLFEKTEQVSLDFCNLPNAAELLNILFEVLSQRTLISIRYDNLLGFLQNLENWTSLKDDQKVEVSPIKKLN